MKKQITSALAVFALLAFAAPVLGQGATAYGGVGVLSPTGDTGDGFDSGFLVEGGVTVGVGSSGFGVGGQLLYSSLGVSSVDVDVNILGVLGTFGIAFGDEGGVRPFVYASGGLLRASADGVESESEFGYGINGGVTIPAGGFSIYVEGGYLGADEFDALKAAAGVAFPL